MQKASPNTLRKKETYYKYYTGAFDEQKTSRVQMTIIRSKQHTVQTITFNKRALRAWMNENEPLPHGHVDSPMRHDPCVGRCW